MRNRLVLMTLFLSRFLFGQTNQGIAIKIFEKKTDGIYPLIRKEVKVILNDTVRYTFITDNTGYIAPIKTSVGLNNIKVGIDSCIIHEIRGIVVGENKTAYVTFQLACNSYLRSLSRKERKKLGYIK